MKKFVAAEIAELNINETANGLFDACIESLILWDKKEAVTPEDPEDKPTNEASHS